MDVNVSLRKILKKGSIKNELEYQRASVIDRQLRLLIQRHPELSDDRKELRAILKSFEDENWGNAEVTDQKVEESDFAVQIAERENYFNIQRKQVIRSRLKERGLTQKDLGLILGHTSETYMSELINGMSPFTLNDLVLIHKLLNIDLSQLIPTTLNTQVIGRVLETISSLNKPKFQFDKGDLMRGGFSLRSK